MNKLILTILLAAGLSACTPPKRVGPPAPIISVGKTAPEFPWVKLKPATPPSRKERVDVYPYRPPASAPDAAGPRSVVPTEKAPEVNAGLRSERATSAPAKTSAPTSAAPVSLPVPKLLPAVGTLVKQAEQQRRAKNLVGAAATLERALGIQPRDPYIWNRLARVRIEQGLYSQAGNLASRSNALVGGRGGALERDNWIIIATARKAAGDLVGSREAWRHARGG